MLVFIYGGGFTQGTANLANYSGEHLAKKGVVYVAMNYRVGAFGFMAHPELSAENARKTSGNWGLLDQVAALQWIHRNIAKFGGDPGKRHDHGAVRRLGIGVLPAVEPAREGPDPPGVRHERVGHRERRRGPHGDARGGRAVRAAIAGGPEARVAGRDAAAARPT